MIDAVAESGNLGELNIEGYLIIEV